MFAFLILSTLLVVLFGAAFVTTRRGRRTELHRLPGPPGLPILGNVLELRSSRLHKKFVEWANIYGGIFRVRLFFTDIVIVTDGAVVGHLLSKGGENLPKAANIYFPAKLGDLPGSRSMFLELTDGDWWKAARYPTSHAFAPDNLRSTAVPVATELVDKMLRRLDKDAMASSSVNMEEYCQQFMLDFIGKWGFKQDFRLLDGNNLHLLHSLASTVHELINRMRSPWQGLLHCLLPFLPAAKAAACAAKTTFFFFERLAREIQEEHGGDSKDDKSLKACLGRMKDPETGEPFDLGRVTANAFILAVGGYENAALQLSWALYDIARNPEAQRRIKQELQEAGLLEEQSPMLEERSPLSRSRPLSLSECNVGLPYFNKVLKESMRRHPAAGPGTFRCCPRDIVISGYTIPAGTQIWMPFYAVHNSAHNFTEPHRFWPERWDLVERIPGTPSSPTTNSDSAATPKLTRFNTEAAAGSPAGECPTFSPQLSGDKALAATRFSPQLTADKEFAATTCGAAQYTPCSPVLTASKVLPARTSGAGDSTPFSLQLTADTASASDTCEASGCTSHDLEQAGNKALAALQCHALAFTPCNLGLTDGRTDGRVYAALTRHAAPYTPLPPVCKAKMDAHDSTAPGAAANHKRPPHTPFGCASPGGGLRRVASFLPRSRWDAPNSGMREGSINSLSGRQLLSGRPLGPNPLPALRQVSSHTPDGSFPPSPGFCPAEGAPLACLKSWQNLGRQMSWSIPAMWTALSRVVSGLGSTASLLASQLSLSAQKSPIDGSPRLSRASSLCPTLLRTSSLPASAYKLTADAKQYQDERYPCATPAGHVDALGRSTFFFGAGPKQCIGAKLADVLLRMVLLSLLRRYWFDMGGEMGDEKETDDAELISVALYCAKGIWLRPSRHVGGEREA